MRLREIYNINNSDATEYEVRNFHRGELLALSNVLETNNSIVKLIICDEKSLFELQNHIISNESLQEISLNNQAIGLSTARIMCSIIRESDVKFDEFKIIPHFEGEITEMLSDAKNIRQNPNHPYHAARRNVEYQFL